MSLMNKENCALKLVDEIILHHPNIFLRRPNFGQSTRSRNVWCPTLCIYANECVFCVCIPHTCS